MSVSLYNLPPRTPAAARVDTREDATGGRPRVRLGVVTISDHKTREITDGEQLVAVRPIRTEPELIARFVPHAL